MKKNQSPLQREETTWNVPESLEDQLLVTKFYVPISSGPLISRPRLISLLNESLKYPLTLISAPAGFGKTTLLSVWSQSLPGSTPRVAWVSLDEEDNDPRLFWIYVLTALDRQMPKRFSALLMDLQSPQVPPLKSVLVTLINLLMEGADHFLLILDDYHLITEQQVHTTLAYLIKHLPIQLRVILATRSDPPLPTALLKVYGQALEVRTHQLRCIPEEIRSFFDQVIGIQLPEKTIQEVAMRTEGWLVGLQLLGLSLPERTDPFTLLEEISGDQRYILDYLTQEVLQRQQQEVQMFLLSTCILEQLNASLCDAVMQQHGSQQILQWIERANLFVVSLDSRRQWYRYHALFAEALQHQLEQTHADLVPILHHRASLWYAQHDQTTQAILHALHAKEWQWATELIEQKSLPLATLTWGVSEHELILLREWIEQLPEDIVHARPLLCLVCAQLLWAIVPHSRLEAWLDSAEAMLTTMLALQVSPTPQAPKTRQEQEDQLGGIIAFRALMLSFKEDTPAVLALCQRALALISEQNCIARIHVAGAQLIAYYTSSANDVEMAIKCGLQGWLIGQQTMPVVSISIMGLTIFPIIAAGRLHEAHQLAQQAILLGTQPGESILADVSFPMVFQAEILRERNQLEAALSMVQEAVSLCKQISSKLSVLYILCAYAILLRVYLSHAELEASRSALQEFDHIGMNANWLLYLYTRSLFTTVDRVRLWLAYGEPNRAIHWLEEVEIQESRATPFEIERREVAWARVLLATGQPSLALQRLASVLQRVTTGKRWGHVIETRLLQALAYEMCQQKTLALEALSEAVRLAEPEGYIRSFVEEGAQVENLLYQLRKRNRSNGPTPYLDTLLTAFEQERIMRAQVEEPIKMQPHTEPLSEREVQVLQLLACGASNQEIAQELVIVIDTVKRHISHIFSKLGVKNRIQAVKQAQGLGILSEEC